jgi:hypothetical protein
MPFFARARDRSGILLTGLPGKRYKRIARSPPRAGMRPYNLIFEYLLRNLPFSGDLSYVIIKVLYKTLQTAAGGPDFKKGDGYGLRKTYD